MASREMYSFERVFVMWGVQPLGPPPLCPRGYQGMPGKPKEQQVADEAPCIAWPLNRKRLPLTID